MAAAGVSLIVLIGAICHLICSQRVLCVCLCNPGIGQRNTQIFGFIQRLGQLLGPLHVSQSSSCWINRRKATNASDFPHLRSCASVYLFHAASLLRPRRLAGILKLTEWEVGEPGAVRLSAGALISWLTFSTGRRRFSRTVCRAQTRALSEPVLINSSQPAALCNSESHRRGRRRERWKRRKKPWGSFYFISVLTR